MTSVNTLVFLAGLTSLDHASVVTGAVGAGVVLRAKSAAIRASETGAVPRLVVRARAEFRRVTGVGLLQLALALEIPTTSVNTLVFLASLASFDHASVVTGAVGARVVLRNGGP